MKEEIKEILDKLNEDKDYDDYIDYKGSYFKPLLDYINNLEKRNKEIYDGFMAITKELCEYATIIDKINKLLECDTHCENIYYAIGVLLKHNYFNIEDIDNEEILNILKGNE